MDSFFFCLNFGPFGPFGPFQDREGGVIGPLPRPNRGRRTTGNKVAKQAENMMDRLKVGVPTIRPWEYLPHVTSRYVHTDYPPKYRRKV